MSDLFNNAIVSLKLGIEDFETGSEERMLSAARNYYAGLLLLAKECLLRAAPAASAMDVIGARFKPKPDGSGGVVHEAHGYRTVDLADLRNRFKDFGLDWPDADIKKLQRLRNDLEHHHLKEPISALSEAIATSFTMVVDFCELLGEDPQEHLSEVWDTILDQRAAFKKVQEKCLVSLEGVQWPGEVSNLDRMACRNCGSSLIGQEDPENKEWEHVSGKCYQCGDTFQFEELMMMVVRTSYEVDSYLMAKEGLEPAITDCPECGHTSYVETGSESVCFCCGQSVAGEYARCSTRIDAHDYSLDYPGLCSHCGHLAGKVAEE